MLRGFEIWANPSSPHAEGRAARAALEDARERVKTALGWEGEVIFTSGASEALAIGLQRAKVDRRIVSAVEHDAVFRAAPDAEEIPIGENFCVDREAVSEALKRNGKAIVAIQHVNSETGAMQRVSDLASQVREAGGWLISDCSQSAGKTRLPDCDMAVVSAHKLGGPVGIGALLVRDFAMLEPTGGHERGYRAGTENLPAALGFAAALEERRIAHETVGEGFNTIALQDWATWIIAPSMAWADHDHFIHKLGGKFQASCHPADETIVALTMPGMSAAAQVIRFDAEGFAVSAGSACSSGTMKPSRTLRAFGVPEEDARNTIRVSAGWNTTFDDIARFVRCWEAIAQNAQRAA
jgi:cysteine desulfurase